MTKRMIPLAAALLLLPLVVALAFWSLGPAATPVAAQDEPAAAPERRIEVTGTGRVSARPDRAVVDLGVTTRDDTAVATITRNSLAMSGVISETLAAGVESDDIQTRGLRLHPIYDDPDEEGERALEGYEASNVVEITIRDLDSVGAILDAAIAAGGNTIQNIRFEVSDNEALLVAAREAAMNDAIAKAEQLTGLAGAELGQVLTITELRGSVPSPVEFESTAALAAGVEVPTAPGTQTVEASVQVAWEIR